MLIILANVIVVSIIITLLAFAISKMISQNKSGSCASCSTSKNSPCEACQFADQCHKTSH